MNCEKFAQRLGSDPASIDEGMADHAASCDNCAQLQKELVHFDRILKSALAVEVPDVLTTAQIPEDKVVPLRAASGNLSGQKGRWFALAATLVLGIGITFGVLLERNASPLPGYLIAHVEHEPNLLGSEWQVVPVARVKQVLDAGRVSLNGDIGTVRHAGICSFRGNEVAHVVVQTENGPVTVMLLPDEALSRSEKFDEEGYQGVMVPVGNGSIAIIGNDKDSVSDVRRRFDSKVAWSI